MREFKNYCFYCYHLKKWMCYYPAFILDLLKVFDRMQLYTKKPKSLLFLSKRKTHFFTVGYSPQKNTGSERVTDHYFTSIRSEVYEEPCKASMMQVHEYMFLKILQVSQENTCGVSF